MSETRKPAAILVADVAAYIRLAVAGEDRKLARLRGLRSDLIDPAIAAHHGRVVKRTGDGAVLEFRSVIDAVRFTIEVQNAMIERSAGVPEDPRIEVHLGDVVEESDGDLMGDGVNRRAAGRNSCARRDLPFRGVVGVAFSIVPSRGVTSFVITRSSGTPALTSPRKLRWSRPTSRRRPAARSVSRQASTMFLTYVPR
jgi:hypothetical protein